MSQTKSTILYQVIFAVRRYFIYKDKLIMAGLIRINSLNQCNNVPYFPCGIFVLQSGIISNIYSQLPCHMRQLHLLPQARQQKVVFFSKGHPRCIRGQFLWQLEKLCVSEFGWLVGWLNLTETFESVKGIKIMCGQDRNLSFNINSFVVVVSFTKLVRRS